MGEGTETLPMKIIHEILTRLTDVVENLSKTVDEIDARLKRVERPFCTHEWGEPHNDKRSYWVRVCVKCGQTEILSYEPRT